MLAWLVSVTGFTVDQICGGLLVCFLVFGCPPMLYMLYKHMVNKPVNEKMELYFLGWFAFWLILSLTMIFIINGNTPSRPGYWNSAWDNACFSGKYDIARTEPQLWKDYCSPYISYRAATEIWNETGINPLEKK